MFPLALGQRVYYVVGFLCHAGAAAASRRSDANKVGPCIAALANDFVLSCAADPAAHFLGGRDEGGAGPPRPVPVDRVVARR